VLVVFFGEFNGEPCERLLLERVQPPSVAIIYIDLKEYKA
jgi:hypothetical protein